ncbi:hypothetical protein ACFWBX_09010 [Streptomyces sp. NPDC059991]|uniref:hypothetical protein n=1 Tax=Streptomyces sp. NPDC059991 TaxID=3347028 RepID=UPI003673B1CC
MSFVRDYVELHFDGPVLRALADPLGVYGGREWRFPAPGSLELMRCYIGKTVDGCELDPDRILAVDFGEHRFVIDRLPSRRSRFRGWEAAMVSWLEELERREAAARDRVTELRGWIEKLTALLVEQEGVVSRLEITRETMREILSAGDAVTGPETGEGGVAESASGPVAGAGSPLGVRLVPTWSVELDAAVLPSSYRDIVEVLGDAVHPMRAHHLCAALGLSTDKNKVEGSVRS